MCKFEIALMYTEYKMACELNNVPPEKIMDYMEYLDVIIRSGHQSLMFVLLN